ncbi:MAG: SDR family NAD(P)-dependent oxidoreductase [Gammaproteobacteria bacterium]|nr:SDR family NAD(P)-dependent oxidoreductase [Gammaproteobacteria bacterium]
MASAAPSSINLSPRRHVLTCGHGARPDDLANKALWLTADVSVKTEVGKLTNKVIAEFGELSILVNNAGFASGQCYTLDGGMTAASPLNPGLF